MAIRVFHLVSTLSHFVNEVSAVQSRRDIDLIVDAVDYSNQAWSAGPSLHLRNSLFFIGSWLIATAAVRLVVVLWRGLLNRAHGILDKKDDDCLSKTSQRRAKHRRNGSDGSDGSLGSMSALVRFDYGADDDASTTSSSSDSSISHISGLTGLTSTFGRSKRNSTQTKGIIPSNIEFDEEEGSCVSRGSIMSLSIRSRCSSICQNSVNPKARKSSKLTKGVNAHSIGSKSTKITADRLKIHNAQMQGLAKKSRGSTHLRQIQETSVDGCLEKKCLVQLHECNVISVIS